MKGTGFSPYINNPIKTWALAPEGFFPSTKSYPYEGYGLQPVHQQPDKDLGFSPRGFFPSTKHHS